MPRELPKSYEPGAIETRWADYWINEKLFAVVTPPPGENTSRLHASPSAAQRNRPPSHGPHAQPDANGHYRALAPHARVHHLVASGHRSCRHRHTDDGGAATDAGRQEAPRHGARKIVERVWEWKKLYGGAILDQMKRLGASVDWSREYFTMDENLSHAVREVFVRLYEEGLIYRGYYIVNWCPWHETAISDLEVKHEEVAGKLWEIRYPVMGTKEFITVATTRPETMLGDTAIAVNAKDERYTLLQGRKVLVPLMGREIADHHRRTRAT